MKPTEESARHQRATRKHQQVVASSHERRGKQKANLRAKSNSMSIRLAVILNTFAIHLLLFVILIALATSTDSNQVLCFEHRNRNHHHHHQQQHYHTEHDSNQYQHQELNSQIALEEEIPLGPPTEEQFSNSNNFLSDSITSKSSNNNNSNNNDATATKGQSPATSRGDEIRAPPLVASSHEKLTRQQEESNSASSLFENQVVDPFAFTFENYLRDAAALESTEALASSSPLSAATTTTVIPTTTKIQSDKQIKTSGNLDSKATNLTTTSTTISPSASGLVIEDEDNSLFGESRAKSETLPRANQVIDYVFPSTSQEQEQQSQRQQQQQQERPPVDKEIKLPFKWKQLLTSKCSRECGRGQRINHISCIDLKFNVRVDNEFCLRYGQELLPRPSELSDEICNEVDCPAQWTSEELASNRKQQQQQHEHQAASNRFKRVRCSRVNKFGETVYVDDSECNNSGENIINSNEASDSPRGSGGATDSRRQFSQEPPPSPAQVADEYSVDLSDGANTNANEISPHTLSISNLVDSNNIGHRQHDHVIGAHNAMVNSNQPFFEPGPWSECSGATCGQLGTRSRKLTCHVYLSRSEKFAELPEASCHESVARKPHTQEPCYMDCPPQLAIQEDESAESSLRLNSTNDIIGGNSNFDETIYDLEMTRYIWRLNGWTKCSAECLGGLRESIIECWDKVAEMAVGAELCQSNGEMEKPAIATETCNDIPCAPEWRLEPFGECTRKCGSAGIRTRSVTCVQQVPIRDGSSGLMVISNDVCLENNGHSGVPHKVEPCNRIHCPPEWSVGPWSECSRKCGVGLRNRTVICVQEFATRDGPLDEGYSYHFGGGETSRKSSGKWRQEKLPYPDLVEAIGISAKNWHPGKVTQVPFHECYEQYKKIPQLDERCVETPTCPEANKELFPSSSSSNHLSPSPSPSNIINTTSTAAAATTTTSTINGQLDDNYQDYLYLNREHSRRKTIVLKIGGKARVPAGKNLKIRCRPLGFNRHSNSRQTSGSGSANPQAPIDWAFEGVKIFINGSKVAEKHESLDDNSILGKDITMYSGDQLMADDPKARVPSGESKDGGGGATTTRSVIIQKNQQPIKSRGGRNLITRSWNTYPDQISFVPQKGGRFSLVRDNTLRIKRLRPDDSGIYTCRHGDLYSESLELKVVSRSMSSEGQEFERQ